MSDIKVPTDSELLDVSKRICDFAVNEMERRGYSSAFSLVPLSLAGDAARNYMELGDILGADGVRELGNATKERMSEIERMGAEKYEPRTS